jgi:hypothetical protein
MVSRGCLEHFPNNFLCNKAKLQASELQFRKNAAIVKSSTSVEARVEADEREQTIRHYIAAYNAFDVDGMLALLAPAVRFENWSDGVLNAEASGIEAFGRLARAAITVFAEREQRITALRVNGETGAVVVDIAFRGRLAADIPDGPRAGTELDLQGESEFSFEGARIARIVDRS